MTRAELRARMTAILKRTRTDADLNSFILSCEEMVATRVRALEMLERASITDADRGSDPTTRFYALPADYLERRALLRTSGNPLWLRPVSLLELGRMPFGYPATSYAINGRELEIRGTPAEDTTFDLYYYARPVALDDGANNTHALLAACGTLYLHGALFWAYLDEEALDLATAHKDAFEKEADRLNVAAKRATRVGGTSFEGVEYYGGGY